MARLLGPDPNSTFCYTLPGGDVQSAAGLIGTVYEDEAGTVLADIAEYDGTMTPGPVIVGSQITVNAYTLIPFFWFPASGLDTLYITVGGGPLTAIYANMTLRLDDIINGGTLVPDTRQVIAGTGLSGGGPLSSDVTLEVVYGSTAGTSTEGNDPRIAAAIPGTRQVIAGTGLSGGGALSSDVTLNVVYGTTAGTSTQGNDTRVVNAVQTSRTLTAGTGLSGGGDLSANRTFAVVYGTTAGTSTEGNDSRVVNAVQTSRTLTAGTGLSGGGDLSANRTFTVVYGTTAGTSAQGNDSRITGAIQGPASATDDALVVFDGTTGKLAQNSNTALVTTTETILRLGVAGGVSGRLAITDPDSAFEVKLGTSTLTANRDIDFPDAAGVVALAGDLSGYVPTSRTLTAGAGLSGGGDLSANRTFAVVYGTTAGTSTEGNDTRVVNAVQTSRTLTAGTGLSGGGTLAADRTFAVVYGTTSGTATEGNDTRVVNAVQTSRTLTAGTGLSGGGDLSANRTFTVLYGTTAGTATEGNDTRVVNAVQTSRTLTAGSGLTGGGDLSANRTFAVDNTARGDGFPRAEDSGYLEWTCPLWVNNNSIAMTSHVYYLSTIRAHNSGTASKVNVHVQGAGTTTDVRVGIYSSAGVLLGKTGNSIGAFGTGLRQFTFTSSFAYDPGKLFAVLWTINTVAPTLTSTTNANGSAAQNDPTPGGTQVRVTGTVSDGGAGTDVPNSLTIAAGGNVTSPAFAQSGQQLWCALVA